MKYHNPHPNDVILDAGCSSGVYSLESSSKGARIIGIDISTRSVRTALKAVKNVNLCDKTQFVVADICNQPFRSNSFDKTLCVDVLEHVENDFKAVVELSRVLKSDGALILHIPQSQQENIFLKKIDHRSFDHVREGYNLKLIKTLLEKANLTIIRSIETFKFFAHLAWEVNYILRYSIFLALLFPILYAISRLDFLSKRRGNGLLLIAKHN
jgi:ubiquinone/menaquinone biosynthesis C-methylase UbiE